MLALTALPVAFAIVGAACSTTESSDVGLETTMATIAEEAAPEPTMVASPDGADLEAIQIESVWVFQHNPEGSNAALHSGTAEIVDGCLIVDNTIVVWHVDRIDDATRAIAAIKAGDTPHLLVGGGGLSIVEGASPDLIPTFITERCPTQAVWYGAP